MVPADLGVVVVESTDSLEECELLVVVMRDGDETLD